MPDPNAPQSTAPTDMTWPEIAAALEGKVAEDGACPLPKEDLLRVLRAARGLIRSTQWKSDDPTVMAALNTIGRLRNGPNWPSEIEAEK